MGGPLLGGTIGHYDGGDSTQEGKRGRPEETDPSFREADTLAANSDRSSQNHRGTCKSGPRNANRARRRLRLARRRAGEQNRHTVPLSQDGGETELESGSDLPLSTPASP